MSDEQQQQPGMASEVERPAVPGVPGVPPDAGGAGGRASGPIVFHLCPEKGTSRMYVRRDTDHLRLASAIAQEWDNGLSCDLICMGRDATYQALRAVPVANGYVAGSGVTFLSDLSFEKIVSEPFDGRSGPMPLLSAQLYQVYEDAGGSKVVREPSGNPVRIRANGPHEALSAWRKHPQFSDALFLRVIKTEIKIRLLPVRRTA